jgi:hypothetical protein
MMIQRLQQGLLADGVVVPLSKLCAWFGVPRRTVYYKPTKASPKVDLALSVPIKAILLAHASICCQAADRERAFLRLSHRGVTAGYE